MIYKDRRGVGICVGTSGAVIALVRSQPPRLVALANVTWPSGLWQHAEQAPRSQMVARRMLQRARRQLALPRWCPTSVVIGPSLWNHPADEVLAESAALLGRARLSQASVTFPDRAASLRREVAAAGGELGAAAASEEAGLAIGAAVASLPLNRADEPKPDVTQVVVLAAAPAPDPVAPPPEPTAARVVVAGPAPATPQNVAPQTTMPIVAPAPAPAPASASLPKTPVASPAEPIPPMPIPPMPAPPMPAPPTPIVATIVVPAPIPAAPPSTAPPSTAPPNTAPPSTAPQNVAPGVWAVTASRPATEPDAITSPEER